MIFIVFVTKWDKRLPYSVVKIRARSVSANKRSVSVSIPQPLLLLVTSSGSFPHNTFPNLQQSKSKRAPLYWTQTGAHNATFICIVWCVGKKLQCMHNIESSPSLKLCHILIILLSLFAKPFQSTSQHLLHVILILFNQSSIQCIDLLYSILNQSYTFAYFTL